MRENSTVALGERCPAPVMSLDTALSCLFPPPNNSSDTKHSCACDLSINTHVMDRDLGVDEIITSWTSNLAIKKKNR